MSDENVCLTIDPENKALEIAVANREVITIEAEKSLQTVPLADKTDSSRANFNLGEITVFRLLHDTELPGTN